MADNHRWFKLWCSAPGDDGLQALPPEWRWAWAVLGCYTKSHGTDGVVVVSRTNAVLAAEMGLKPEHMFDVISRFPHVSVTPQPDRENDRGRDRGRDRFEEVVDRYGEFTVTWHHWRKYQEDSTTAERMQRYRTREALRSKRRRDKKRIDNPPNPPTDAPPRPRPRGPSAPPGDRPRSVWSGTPTGGEGDPRSESPARAENPGTPLTGPIAEFMATLRQVAASPTRGFIPPRARVSP